MATISHALVLPNQNFMAWYQATSAYTAAFERVAIVRSPAGNDLNRFRNISAVQTPGVWFDNDPVGHIRRAYPNVVRIDVIKANTPQDLIRILAERIQRSDRFGAWQNDGHIVDRMVLSWPSDSRPARVVRRFGVDLPEGRKNEGMDISATPGSVMRAAAAGTVTAISKQPAPSGYGEYVQITTPFAGLTYVVTYTQLQAITAQNGQTVKVGDPLGVAVGPTSKIVVQQVGGGLSGYALPNVINPTPLIYWDDLRLRTTVDGLRLREKPGTQYPAKGQIYLMDSVEALETHGRVLEKLGEESSWIRLRTPGGLEGYSAAWYLAATTREIMATLNNTGMNIDLLHPLGKPRAERMAGLGWLRFPYKSAAFNDMNSAHVYYDAFMRQYAAAGFKQMVILTHQTYGEGAGYHWPSMYSDNRARWNDYIPQFVERVRNIAQRYAGRNMVDVYQIWNEQDTPPASAEAAVPIRPEDYARLLTETIRAIRAIDPVAKIITGGHMSGPENGGAYARATIAAMPSDVRPDGIACHSYGRGAPGSSPRYSIYGLIDDDIITYGNVLPGKPVWITEFGVLDRPNDSPEAISAYATSFMRHINSKFSRQVASAVWYAWADGMHNGYGLVDRNDKPKYPFYDEFLDL